MMRIAFCDDDAECLALLVQYTADYQQRNEGGELEPFVFHSPAELLDALDAHRTFDLFFLDILMPQMDGIELGQRIRRSAPRAPIAYLTSSSEYALSAYGVKALRYLLKPIAYDDFAEALTAAVQLAEAAPSVEFVVKVKNGLTRLDTRQIVAVESVSHTIRVLLKNGDSVSSVTYRQPFVETARPLLTLPSFLQPHQSYVINMEYVKQYKSTEFVMDNELRIPISRSNISAVRTKYLQYLSNENLFSGGGG